MYAFHCRILLGEYQLILYSDDPWSRVIAGKLHRHSTSCQGQKLYLISIRKCALIQRNKAPFIIKGQSLL